MEDLPAQRAVKPQPPKGPPPAHLLAAKRATAAPSEATLDSQVCENGHPLVQFAAPCEGCACNVCFLAVAKGSTLYGCRACNFDKCPKCCGFRIVGQDDRIGISSSTASPEDAKEKPKLMAWAKAKAWPSAESQLPRPEIHLPKAVPLAPQSFFRPPAHPADMNQPLRPGFLNWDATRPLLQPRPPVPEIRPPAPPPPCVANEIFQAAQQAAYFSRVNQLLQAGIQTLTAQAAARAAAAFTSAPPDSDLVGFVTIKRGSTRSVKVRAALMFGSMDSVRNMLTQAAAEVGSANGALGISHRVPFDDLARRTPLALLAFSPDAADDEASYSEYFQYFEGKSRAGVINLKDANANIADSANNGGGVASLYIAPRSALEANDDFCSLVEEGEKELGSVSLAALTMLQDRDDCLVGVLASSPFLSASAGNSGNKDDPVVPSSVQTDALQSSVKSTDNLQEEAVDDFPDDDDVADLNGLLEGEETEDSGDDAGPEAKHSEQSQETDLQASPTIGHPPEKETSIIELASFIGEWRDSLGNDVFVSWKGSQELLVSLSRPLNRGREVRLNITQLGESKFMCGHYSLDIAASSVSRMVWQNDITKENGHRSKQLKSSTWVRVTSSGEKKRSRSRSKMESMARKQSKHDDIDQVLLTPSDDTIKKDQDGEELPADSTIEDDLQTRLDNLLSQLT